MSSQVAFGLDPLSFPSLNFATSPLCGPSAPTAAAWASLNETVGGRLYHGHPFAKACFSTYNGNKVTPNLAECAYVQENYFNNHSESSSWSDLRHEKPLILLLSVNRSHAFGGYGSVRTPAFPCLNQQINMHGADAIRDVHVNGRRLPSGLDKSF